MSLCLFLASRLSLLRGSDELSSPLAWQTHQWQQLGPLGLPATPSHYQRELFLNSFLAKKRRSIAFIFSVPLSVHSLFPAWLPRYICLPCGSGSSLLPTREHTLPGSHNALTFFTQGVGGGGGGACELFRPFREVQCVERSEGS